MIIRDGEAAWNLEGNFMRKVFVTSVALKNKVSTETIIKQYPTVIADLIGNAGNMTIPYLGDCLTHMFQRLY